MLAKLHHKLKTFRLGGVHLQDMKLTAHAPIDMLPLPSKVIIPIIQHRGVPATVNVKVGDHVKVGQIIATHTGLISSNIHASVSGTVSQIHNTMDNSGFKHTSISIQRKGDAWLESIDRTEKLDGTIKLTQQEIVNKILEHGVVGMGGAAFPSHVKLSESAGKHIDHLIVNGVECEPYLTADHRLMLEKPKQIIVGIRILMKALKVDKAIIGIENNKQDAIALMSKLVQSETGIIVTALEVQYPQGSEKQLIQALLNREVPSGGLPADVGVIVHNVGTTYAVYEAVQKNKPLIERVVTVSGKEIKHPSNFLVRIGTPVQDLLIATGGIPKYTGKIISGGPMMGKAIADVQVPVTKAMSGILLIPEEEATRAESYNCVRCGKCIEVCPMGLEPYRLLLLSKKGNTDQAKEEHIVDCIECGSCSFVCPSNRPIVDFIRLGKTQVKKL